MILDDSEKKISYFNKIGIHYEAVYHYVIRRRKETSVIYDLDFLDDITAGLIVFDMQRMMANKKAKETKKYKAEGTSAWALRLNKKLQKHRSDLVMLQQKKLTEADLDDASLKSQIIRVFDCLAKSGSDGLNLRKPSENFAVGASKILHFLIPDFFIILDSNSRQELAKHHEGEFFKSTKVNGDLYLKAMCLYQKELNEWKIQQHDDNNFNKLCNLDPAWRNFCGCRHTPLPRIIDKCTFAGDKM
jgi:hypothetical protein